MSDEGNTKARRRQRAATFSIVAAPWYVSRLVTAVKLSK
jgi:hypothetical protein